eukprot:scaffold112930_cov18-Tisochrysis_lutea.AAC.1
MRQVHYKICRLLNVHARKKYRMINTAESDVVTTRCMVHFNSRGISGAIFLNFTITSESLQDLKHAMMAKPAENASCAMLPSADR